MVEVSSLCLRLLLVYSVKGFLEAHNTSQSSTNQSNTSQSNTSSRFAFQTASNQTASSPQSRPPPTTVAFPKFHLLLISPFTPVHSLQSTHILATSRSQPTLACPPRFNPQLLPRLQPPLRERVAAFPSSKAVPLSSPWLAGKSFSSPSSPCSSSHLAQSPSIAPPTCNAE